MRTVAIITCYKYPDYGRAVNLRAGLLANPDIQTIVIKNRYKSIFRYPEVLLKVITARVRHRPDMYLLTFRGYEMLPAVSLLALGKPVILDELINPLEVVSEHRQLYKGKLTNRLMSLWQLFGSLYNLLLRHCRAVIADTAAHADYSSKMTGMPRNRYQVIPVGANESIFKSPSRPVAQSPSPVGFTVLYYGSMVPLHGLSYVLEAAEKLEDQPHINFLLIGGSKNASIQIEESIKNGARITHKDWVEPKYLPKTINQAGLCLGGPFGDTIQSQLVITGKTFEFLASAAPALIGETKETATSKQFKDKVNCLMVPQGNAAAIAEAIVWASTHPNELSKIGLAGSQLYKQSFSQSIIAQKLAKMIDELS